ncbi:U6 snRNA-associated Sm-like protein LSm7 [Wilcoxina mikolae CBS 423.85]|nr:U6 snRNA-associated Sm-like protein LSm7 [Wilcoxina mikolae CBS 423.85]KAF8535005.1 hypothetical protein BDD12DRAFT_918752 [Trichophaea hybrida]
MDSRPRGNPRGNPNSSSRGSSRGGGRGGHAGGSQQERKPREAILDLSKFKDKAITVKFNGGREVEGILKGYDQLMNLVLDDVKETLRDDEGNEHTRELGLVVARGPMLTLISPVDGSERIENPFMAQEG